MLAHVLLPVLVVLLVAAASEIATRWLTVSPQPLFLLLLCTGPIGVPTAILAALFGLWELGMRRMRGPTAGATLLLGFVLTIGQALDLADCALRGTRGSLLWPVLSLAVGVLCCERTLAVGQRNSSQSWLRAALFSWLVCLWGPCRDRLFV